MKRTFAALLIMAAVSPHAAWAATAQEQAKMAEVKARAAWTDKVSAYQLCQVQDEVAAQYRARLASTGQTAPQPVATPACTDPGPFTYSAEPGTQPLEGAGAHSPAETAKQPPNTSAPESASKPLAK